MNFPAGIVILTFLRTVTIISFEEVGKRGAIKSRIPNSNKRNGIVRKVKWDEQGTMKYYKIMEKYLPDAQDK